MAGKEISFRISAKDETAGTFKKISGNMTAMSRDLGDKAKGVNSSLIGMLSIASVVPIIGAIKDAVFAAINYLSDLEEAFLNTDKAAKKLDFAAAINKNLGATATDLKMFSSQLSDSVNGMFDDGDIMAALGSMSFDKTAAQLKQIGTVGLDLAAVLDVDVKDSFTQLNNLLAGTTGQLGKMFPELKTLTKEQLLAGQGIDIVGQKIKGFAEKLGGDGASSVIRFKNAIGDLHEESGALVTSFFTPLRDWLTQITSGWANALKAKREYANQRVTVENGTADSTTAQIFRDQRFSDLQTPTNKSQYAQVNGKQADFDAMVYATRQAINAQGGSVSGGTYSGNMNTADLQTLVDRISKQKLDTGILQIFSEYIKASDQYDKAKAKETEDARSAAEEEKKRIAEEKKASEDKQRAELVLAAKLKDIANQVSAGKITEAEGGRLTSELTDKNYTEAVSIQNDPKASKDLKAVAAAFIVSWNISQEELIKKAAQKDEETRKKAEADAAEKAQKESDERLKAEAETAEKKKKADQEYLVSLKKAILDGFSPAKRALHELETSDLFKSLQEKYESGTGTDEEKSAYESLMQQRSQLFSAYAEERRGEQTPQAGKGTSVFDMFISKFGEMFKSISSIQQLLDPMSVILNGIFSVIGPAIDDLLSPLIGMLTIIGTTIGQILLPVISALTPVIEALTTVFIWLYNNILLPIGNGIIDLFEMLVGGLTDVINGAIRGINNVLTFFKQSTIAELGDIDFAGFKLQEITVTDVNGAGSSAVSESKSSGGASYTAARDIYVNIYFSNSYVNGDAREIALNLRKEIKLAEAMGM